MTIRTPLVRIGNQVGFLESGDSLSASDTGSKQTLSGMFVGVVEATTAGFEHKLTVEGAVGTMWRLALCKVTHSVHAGSTGTTTLQVADAGVGGTPTVSTSFGVAIATTSGTASEPTDFEVESGTVLFVTVATSGEHSYVQFQLTLEQI